MKLKIYSLLMIAFILITSSISIVNADTNSTNRTELKITKTINVNNTKKIKKLLTLKGKKINDFSFTTSSSKIAKISNAGTITGVKAGKATITVREKESSAVYARVSVKVKDNYKESDLRYLSSIIYSESGNQVYAGKQAVGIVVMNRVKSSKFPNSITGVIYQSGQFTPARNGSLSRSLSLYDSGKLSSECIKAAKAVLNGDNTVSYGGRDIDMSNYLFFSGYVSGCRLQIQGHQFK